MLYSRVLNDSRSSAYRNIDEALSIDTTRSTLEQKITFVSKFVAYFKINTLRNYPIALVELEELR